MSISERFAFFTQGRSNFEQTGAIQPSSRQLAEAMAAPLRRFRATNAIAAVRILEVGPGTGAITRAIATYMEPQDELDCYEINAEFVQYLDDAIRRDAVLTTIADQIASIMLAHRCCQGTIVSILPSAAHHLTISMQRPSTRSSIRCSLRSLPEGRPRFSNTSSFRRFDERSPRELCGSSCMKLSQKNQSG